MINFDDLWLQPMEGFNEKNKGRTEEQILAREAKIGFKLPHSYREMMKVQNGGLLNKAMYSFEGTTMELYFSGFDAIDETAGYNTFEDILKEDINDEEIRKYANSDICIPSRLPILSQMDGHCYLCFDYGWLQENPITEPEICLFDLEAGDYFAEVLRIKNFDTFINNLYYAGYSAESFKIGISANLEIEEVMQIISEKLQLTFIENSNYRYIDFNFTKWYYNLSPEVSLRFDITHNQYKSGTYIFQNLKNINCILEIRYQSAGLMPETTMTYIENLIHKIEVLKPIVILKPLIMK